MLRRLLLTTILATTALANADEGVSAANSPFGVLGGSTVSCSVTNAVAGCYWERPVAILGPFEFTVGIDTQAAYAEGRTSHLAAYAGVAYYAPTWSAWLELYNPRANLPTIGRPDWFRLGFTWRLP